MQKLKTTEDILNSLPPERADLIRANVAKEVAKIHGGKREGAGRKPKGEYALNIQVKVNKVELEFLKQARELGANLNLIDLKQYAQ